MSPTRALTGVIAFLSAAFALAAPPLPRRGSVLAEIPHASIAAITIDAGGSIYAVGTSSSQAFDTTADAVKRHCDGGGPCYGDAIVVRMTAGGVVTYSTYLGGRSNETGNAIAVDRDGNMYVAGTSWSADFPVVTPVVAPRASQQGFVTKINRNGKIVFSTTLGGEGITGIALDAKGAVFVCGFVYGSIPAVRPIQAALAGPPDAFVAKLAPDGSRIEFSTYLGGSSTDTAHAIALDDSGSAVIVGDTASADFPVVRPAQAELGGGSRDGFIARLAADGSRWEYSTLLGGRGADSARAVVVDHGVAFVTGGTDSPDFPVTAGAMDTTCGSDGLCDAHTILVRGRQVVAQYLDGFVASVGEWGDLRFGTFLGGDRDDEGRAVATGPDGIPVVAGFSTSHRLAKAPPALCESEFACPPFISRIEAWGTSVVDAGRMPVSASYSPWFDVVTMALTDDGRPLVASNLGGRGIIATFDTSSGRASRDLRPASTRRK